MSEKPDGVVILAFGGQYCHLIARRIRELKVETSGLSEDVWQYFPVFTDTRSMGVKGDERVYGCTVAIRVVESVYGMTASFSKSPCGLLERVSTRIINEVPEVTRVVYEITHKPPSTIECE